MIAISRRDTFPLAIAVASFVFLGLFLLYPLFNVFGAKVIAMIGRPSATILSRSITITLHRKTAGERVEPLRDDRLRAELAPLRQQWRRWVLDHLEALRVHDPAIPGDLPVNRASDNWRPLLSTHSQSEARSPSVVDRVRVPSSGSHRPCSR